MYEQNIASTTMVAKRRDLVDPRFTLIDRPKSRQFGGGFGRVHMDERSNSLTRRPDYSSKTAE